MKGYKKVICTLFFTCVVSFSVFSQPVEPGSLKAGQKVDVEYYPQTNKWIPATIVEVLNDGYSYKVKVAPYGDGKEITDNVHYKRVRIAVAVNARNDNKKASISDALIFGKYGCTASEYKGGEVKYLVRGSFTISKDGRYTYYGFKNPSNGTFTVDKKGSLHFKGAILMAEQRRKLIDPTNFSWYFPEIPIIAGPVVY